LRVTIEAGACIRPTSLSGFHPDGVRAHSGIDGAYGFAVFDATTNKIRFPIEKIGR